jgi:hypothetical protein
MGDPFKVRSAETEDPREIGLEFVEDYTEYAKIAAHEHTVTWGSRGSGKTMHVRNLEPAAWIARHCPDTPAEGFAGFLRSKSGFLGIYINCREPALSREEFRLLERDISPDNPELYVLTDRYLAQIVLSRLALTFESQLDFLLDVGLLPEQLPSSLRRLQTSPNGLLSSFCRRATSDTKECIDRLLPMFEDLFLHRTASQEGLLWLKDLPTLQPDIVTLLATVRQAIGSESPFFLMFDEANELSPGFQMAVAALLARRSQRELCIKVASQLQGFRTERVAGRPVQEIHDFVSIDLDSLYTNNQDAYYRRVRDIALYRLKRAGIEGAIELYLPPNPSDAELMGQARRIAEERYDRLPGTERPQDRANFIKKYAPAIVFQTLASPKARKSYAGFDNLVHLSSGIIRSFLDCCSSMYGRFVESNPGIEPTSIPINVQNAVIETYSDEFIDGIRAKMESLRANTPERQEFADLYNLMNGLGALFRTRLMDQESREPRIISVSLKDEPDTRLARALELAVQDAYLHKVLYTSKRGTRRLPCYVLNRRLCPHYGLDVAGFQGRLEVSAQELALALDGTGQFVPGVLGRARRTSDEGDEGQTQLWEW